MKPGDHGLKSLKLGAKKKRKTFPPSNSFLSIFLWMQKMTNTGQLSRTKGEGVESGKDKKQELKWQ
jgi:hypothetical protein